MADLILNVEQGAIRGCTLTLDNGASFNAFMGIPYAKPPVGDLRFKDPQYPEKWEGVRDCTKEGDDNAQIDTVFGKGLRGSEDCLYLNVYVPIRNNGKLPVMVWIHGGGFTMGSGSRELYGPDYIVQSDVIVVTINYRLGPFGFLCLNNAEVPGNAGLKDQAYALRWVYKNIATFGGDVDNITVFGESAGSASVHYQILSPMSKGLFHKAIMQSGTATCIWARTDVLEKSAFHLAKDLGLESTDKEAVLKFLRQVSVEDILKATTKDFSATDMNPFRPVLEHTFAGVESFITVSPAELMASGNFNKVPLINGVTSQEGVFFLMKSICKIEDFGKVEKLEDMNYDFKKLLRNVFEDIDDETLDRIMKKIAEFYSTRTNNVVEQFVDILSDLVFVRDVDLSIKMHSKHHPVYAYDFCYNGALNLFKLLVGYPYTGSSHGDDLSFLFKPHLKELPEGIVLPTITDSDLLMIKKMVTLWTNFAKYGNPTPEVSDVIDTIWKPVSGDNYPSLELDVKSKIVPTPFGDRMSFWKDLFKN